jgi:AmpD protein
VQQLFTNTLDWSAHPYFRQIEGMQVSSHFYIRRDGALWQFVGCDDRAWHAGQSQYRGRENCNDDSIGIELEGLEGGPFEPAQYETLGAGFDWKALGDALGWPARGFPAAVQALLSAVENPPLSPI